MTTMEADAIEDVVDTSDVEEKEAMEAQKPGYYDRVWGVSEVRITKDSLEL